VEENRGQGVIRNRQKWWGCLKGREEKAVYPRERKAQQDSTWSGELECTAKKEISQRDIRRMFKILREVWMNIGVEKLNMHEGIKSTLEQ